jgi:hypothetical protein
MASECPSEPQKLLFSLVSRCQNLLSELEMFQNFLALHKKQNTVELGHFKHLVISELRSLEKLKQLDASGSEPKTLHSLQSSNLAFHEAVWLTAKRCEGLVAMSRRVRLDGSLPRDARQNETFKGQRRREGKEVSVDIVARGGAEWIKISLITETRLGFEIAKKGWETGLHSDDESEDEEWGAGQDVDTEDLKLLRLASDLKCAAASYKVKYMHPRVRFVLPKIAEGRVPEVDKIILEMRNTGATVECGMASTGNCSITSDEGSVPTPGSMKEDTHFSDSSQPLDSEKLFNRLLQTPYVDFTPTLNIDCTVLLAIISDLSTLRPSSIPPLPGHHFFITRQIENPKEAAEPLLPTHIWPAMASRKLICTFEAAKRMREIVSTIGTEAEKERMCLIMGEGAFEGLESKALIEAFQKRTEYQVPLDWNLPIRVVESEPAIAAAFETNGLPPVARKVESRLTAINRSVFLYGWATGTMTLSSNRAVVKMIEGVVEEEVGEVMGPQMWICGTARSLVGKEKRHQQPMTPILCP